MRNKFFVSTTTKIIAILGLQSAMIAVLIIAMNNTLFVITPISGISAFIILVIPSFALFFIVNTEFTIPIKKIARASSHITDAATEPLHLQVSNELNELVINLKHIDTRIANATAFARNIGEGKFDVELATAEKDFGLGTALDEMRSKLKNIAEEERKRNWAIEGIAKFGQLFRDLQNDEIKEFAHVIILNLVKYIHVNQGAVFIVNDNDISNKYIELTACYAYEKRKNFDKRLQIGEGLLGQCMIDREYMYINDVPDDYINIRSGLGSAHPKALLLVPLKINEEVFGAIELASFREIELYQIKLVNEIAESFSATLSSARINHHTQKLLLESQLITNELRTKENELMTNEEELRSAQETLNNKLIELQAETNLTKCILEAINKSNAAIEFDMDGNILNANEMFLSVMGYEKHEIVGTDEKIMVPQDEINSQRYAMLWDSLKKGNFNTGEFRRYAKSGKEVWIDATYNPILDLRGTPYKILMFANFTTEAKEKENDYRNRIQALNDTFGFLEINPDFTIKSANQIFLDQLQLKRKDVKSRTFDSFIYTTADKPELVSNMKTELMAGNPYKQNISFLSSEGTIKKYLAAIYISNSISGNLVSYFALLISSSNTSKSN